MKKNVLAFLLFLWFFHFPLIIWGKTWNDVTPGTTKKIQVIEKFGAPTKDISRGGEYSRGILYQAKQAIEGTRQVQFFFDESDSILAIHVFPKTDLKKEQIIKAYGSEYEEKLSDSFKTYFFYKKDGLVVYFQEGNQIVSSLTFQKPTP